jgi:hypothetical protein
MKDKAGKMDGRTQDRKKVRQEGIEGRKDGGREDRQIGKKEGRPRK